MRVFIKLKKKWPLSITWTEHYSVGVNSTAHGTQVPRLNSGLATYQLYEFK
jgi:hypothetical protein